MRVLVTGAAGFIGFHVCQYLLERGDQVLGIDSVNDYYDPVIKRARLAILGAFERLVSGKEILPMRHSLNMFLTNPRIG